jgi:hypothetical protein
MLINDRINSLETKSCRGKNGDSMQYENNDWNRTFNLRDPPFLCLRNVLLDSNPNVRSYLVNNIVNSIQQSMAYIENSRLNTLKNAIGRYAVVLKERMSLLAGRV